MLPAVLRLSLSTPPRADSRQHRKESSTACSAAGGVRRAPQVALAHAARAPPANAPGMTPERQAAFDDALGSGQLNAALAVLRQAAAAAPGGGGRLLGPQRNRALLQACFARGRPDLLVTYLTLVPPELAPWSAVLAECNRRQDLHTLKRVLAARRAAGLGLEDQRVATAAISGYAGAGRLSDALATFCRAWEEAPCRTVEVANAAISACANQGNWEAAQEVRRSSGGGGRARRVWREGQGAQEVHGVRSRRAGGVWRALLQLLLALESARTAHVGYLAQFAITVISLPACPVPPDRWWR